LYQGKVFQLSFVIKYLVSHNILGGNKRGLSKKLVTPWQSSHLFLFY
jgi:hypothetical protein